MKIEYNGEIIEFIVEYKKRKTVEVKIDFDLKVRVLAPKGISEEIISEVLKTKVPLVIEQLKQIREKSKDIKEKEHVSKEEFLYLGKKYPTKLIIDENAEKNIAKFEADVFIITIKKYEEEIIKDVMLNFYKKECNKIIKTRISFYQNHFKMKPNDIKIVDSKNNWGTCNSHRNMEFNWKLAMAPIKIIDYIVVHEMCHMMHLNHSKSYWRLVGKIIPDYKKRDEWLQHYGFFLKI